MRASRLVLLVIVVGVAVWLFKSSSRVALPGEPGETSTAPMERARAAARKSDSRAAQTDAAAAELDTARPAAAITEDMTPDQVRALLGEPDSVTSETTESGTPRERWVYRKAGKTVLFENGIAVRIE